MAKELPYFKFETGRWLSGEIQLCSRESKGLFLDICSRYWERTGELSCEFMEKVLGIDENDEALNELCNREILNVEEGYVVINFLDEQLEERKETSKSRQKAAISRWNKVKEKRKNKKGV